MTEFGKEFLGITPKAHRQKKKLGKSDCIKRKKLYFKHTIKKVKSE